MIPGAKKRRADFTDVVMYVAIASKHLRLIILLITLALAAGLLFYIFSRPVYFSKSIIRYQAIGTDTPDADTRLKGDDYRRFSDNKFLNDFEAEHVVKRTDNKLASAAGLIRSATTLSLGDLKHPASLAGKLKQHADKVSSYLHTRLSEPTRRALEGWRSRSALPTELQLMLIGDLNAIITGPSIYDEQLFDRAAIWKETRDLLNGDLSKPEEVARLNRNLLEAVYPLEFSKAAGKSKADNLKQVRATWTTDHNIELNVWAYKPEWVVIFPSNMVEVFLEDRRERAFRQFQAETNKYQEVIADLSRRWQEQLRVEGRLTAEFNPEKLKFELEQLQTVPRSLDLFRRKLQEWEYVDKKVNNPVYTDSERLQFYYSIDYNVDAGVFVDVDPATRERLPANARPSNGTVIIRSAVGRTGADEWYELEQEKLRLERTIKEMSLTFKPSHPKMQTLYQQYNLVERKVKEALGGARAKFEIHGRRLKQRVAELQAQQPLWEKNKSRYEEYLKEVNLIRNGAVRYDQMIYDIQKKISEAELALRNERVDLKFLEFENLRDEIPISPNRLKIVLLSLGLGIGLALGVPFLLEFMDQTVTNLEKMEEATNIRGLGLVPDFEDDIAEAYPLMFNDGVANPDFIENFRVIRTNLLASAANSRFPQVIMVTSTSPKEGKTVVASNLALSFAQMGEKTLIVDANLRRGVQHHLFGSRSAPGLSNVLIEKFDVEDACRPTAMENLHILPCGDELEGDIEQLGAPAFAAAIEKLRKRYQRIIVDSTPVLGLAETSIMQPAMDGVLLVIQCGQTPTRAVRTAIEILEANHANFYGFVLNRLDLMATMNRFHYYYYTNHYYNRYQSLTRAKD